MAGILEGRRIGLLTASASRLNGGAFEAVVAQAELIARLGGEPVVIALHDRHSDEDRARFGGATVVNCAVKGPPQVGYAPDMERALLDAKLDCLHLHGIWMYPSRAGAAWARATGRPYFISPHGMLDPWITARGRWKKALARVGYERGGWRIAHAFHALTSREAGDIARESGREDSLVIANAGPAASPLPVAPRAPELVSIGRIHPKKNLLALVAAWRSLARPAEARLTIAGWGADGDVAELKAMLAANDKPGDDSVRFVGPVYGAAKQELLDSARFVVLPSLSEGLPMAVLESWAAGGPTVMTSECNLPEGFAAGAALECGITAETIAPVLARALAMDDDSWLTMAGVAHGLATGPFAADTIAARWGEAYSAAIAAKPGRTAR